MKILKGHISPATAYVVDDYPFGFTLRCRIRYWLEYKAGHGVRFVSQTTNPRRAGEVWNKPKASTYCRFGGCMVLNDEGHVKWTGLTAYCTGAEAKAWADKYAEGVPEGEAKEVLKLWVGAKLMHDMKTQGVKVIEMTPTAEGVREIHETIRDVVGE